MRRGTDLESKTKDAFLLTVTPNSPRSKLCLKLIARSEGARVYLTGDGVYHLLGIRSELSSCTIYACKEDLEARGIRPGEKVNVPEDFYSTLVEDIMEHADRVYTV